MENAVIDSRARVVKIDVPDMFDVVGWGWTLVIISVSVGLLFGHQAVR